MQEWPRAWDGDVAANKRNERFDFVPEPLRGKFPVGWTLMLENNMRIVLEINLVILFF
jgi:hypothetical protein